MASIFDPIYAALEDGAYEEAVKLCSKPDLARFTVTQALLSYAYASLRQNSKAMDLARRIIQTKPKEEIVLSTLAYTLRKCRADKELLSMYETAINTPGSTFSEGFVHELFTCYCMEGDLKKMQMLAQKQYKLHPEKAHFLCWSVACMVQLDQRNPAELPPTMLMVAERTLKKVLFDLQKEKQPSADELVLYLCVLARQAKQQALDASSGSPYLSCKETLRAALTALEELTGRKRHGKASMLLSDQKHFEQRPDLVSVHRLQRSVMKLDLLVRLGDVLALGTEARAVLQDYPDQWNVHKLLIECVIYVGFAAASGTNLLVMPEETVSTQRVDEQYSGSSSSSTENPIFQSFPSPELSLGYRIEQLLSSAHSNSSCVLNSKALDSSVVEHRAFLAGLQASAVASTSAKAAAAVGSEGSKNTHSNSDTAGARIRGPFLAELELLLTYRRLLQVSGADMRLPLGWMPSADIPPLHPTLAANPEALPPPPPPTDNEGQGAELVTEIVALIEHYCELFSSKQSCFSDVKRYVYALRSSPSALAALRRWALSERDRHLDPLMGASITALAPYAFASNAGDAVSADADGQQGLPASIVRLKICEEKTDKEQVGEEGEDEVAAGGTGAAVVCSVSPGADAGATGGASGGGGGGGAKKNKKKKKKKTGSTGGGAGGAGASARAVAATTSPADDDSGGKPCSALPTGETLRGEIAGSSTGQKADEYAELLLRLCQYCKLDQLAAYCSQLIARYGLAVDGCPDRETANESVADIAAATTPGLGTGRGDDCVSTSASFRAALYSATKFLTDGCIGGDREYQPGDELLLQSSYESFHRFANLAKRSDNNNYTSTTMSTMGEKATVGDRQQEAIAAPFDRQQQHQQQHQQQLVCCMEWAQSLVYGSSKSPYCYGFRIELLHAYRHLAVGDGSVAAFQGLGAKHTQMDSMSYLILPVLLETGMFQEALRQHRSVLAFHASAVRETKEAVAQTFQFGTYMKGLEISRFAELCNKSIQRALSKAEYPLLELTQRYFLWTEALTYLRNVAEPKKLPESHDFALSKGFSDAELLQLTDNNDYAQLVTTDAIPADAYTPSIADGELMKKVETQTDCSLGINLRLEDEAYSLGWDSANERAARRRQLIHRVQIADLSSRLLRCVLERHLGEATEYIARLRLCLPTSNALIHRSAAVIGEGERQCEDMGSFPLKWSQRISEGSDGDDGGFTAALEGGAFSRAVWEATLSSMELCVAAMRCNQSETGGETAAATANVSASKMDGDVSSSDSSDSIRLSAMHCVELLLHVRDLLLVDSTTELHEEASSVFSPVAIRRASFFCFSLASWLPLVLQCVLATLPYSSITGVGSEAQLDREILQLRALYPFSLLRSSVTAKSTTKSPDSGSGSDSATEVDSALGYRRSLSAYIGMLDEVFASSETADAPSENLVGRTVLLLALVLLDILVGLRFSLATPSEIRKSGESASAAPDTARVGSTSSRQRELGTACGDDESDNAESTAAVAVLNLYHRLADRPLPTSNSSSSSLSSSTSALTSAFASHSSTIGVREDTGTANPPPLSKGAVPAPAGYDEALQSVARQMVASHRISRDRLRQLLAQKIDSLLGNLNLRSSTLRAMES